MRFSLVILAIVLISESILTGLIPHSKGYLFEFLELKDGPVYIALGLFFCNYLCLDFFQSIKEYCVLKVSLAYRILRTNSIINSINKNIKNVPQRIQEDIKLSYISRITVWCEYFISGTILVQLIILNLGEPILVAAALIYAGISVLIAMRFNPRLNYAEKAVQEKEATFRSSLANTLNISLIGVTNNTCLRAGIIRMQYLLFTKLQLGLITVLPYIVLIPDLFDGTIGLGELMRHQATFSLIVVNAAILIQFYPLLVQGNASEERVKEMLNEEDV